MVSIGGFCRNYGFYQGRRIIEISEENYPIRFTEILHKIVILLRKEYSGRFYF
jgi:hypothetical protein